MGNGRSTRVLRLGVVCVALLATSCAATGSSGGGAPAAATATTTVDGHPVTVSVPTGQSVSVAPANPAAVPDAPTDLTFPLGALAIDVDHVTVGGLATVTVHLDTAVNSVNKLINGAWEPFVFDGSTGAILSADGKTITVYLRDGGRGDTDGVANGSIADPLAPTYIDETLLASDIPAIVELDSTANAGYAPLTVHYSAQGCYDPDGTPVFIHWNFSALGGDYSDGFATSELNPTRTYTTPGNYRVLLTVSDSFGVIRSNEEHVEIIDPNVPPDTTPPDTTPPNTDQTTTTTSTTSSTSTTTTTPTTTSPPTTSVPGDVGPVAVAQVITTDGVGPVFASFSSAGSFDPDGSIVAYSWNFGDGTPLQTVANPDHVYVTPGVYLATLTVTDDDGNQATSSPVVVTVLP